MLTRSLEVRLSKSPAPNLDILNQSVEFSGLLIFTYPHLVSGLYDVDWRYVSVELRRSGERCR